MQVHLRFFPLAGCLLILLSFLSLHTAIHHIKGNPVTIQTCSTVVIHSISTQLCFSSKSEEVALKRSIGDKGIQIRVDKDRLAVNDDKRNLVITGVAGEIRHFHAVNRLVWSLRDTGSQAEVAIFHPDSDNFDPNLYEKRFGGVFTVPYKKSDRQFELERFLHFADWMDVTHTIGDCRFHRQWIGCLYGGEDQLPKSMMESNRICAGASYGNVAGMKKYFRLLADKIKETGCNDQGIHNWLYYTGVFEKEGIKVRVDQYEDAIVGNMATVPEVTLNAKGQVLNGKGQPYTVLHAFKWGNHCPRYMKDFGPTLANDTRIVEVDPRPLSIFN
ncbi:hypothetical protein BCR33DRAFT_712964 [Rhizoclosmatium globosum]|uniref:Uncharacterized protein n=1 Tax=Rhizoclosmatium globosum TaxID=329046 RepID=A0A1Y2CW41_9FUNG|nr:hypothetical protein BCR33DRAFT_712964 [Rhizoclosmatium globosum]|eukprot:ORY51034.1 hypothetical protein BCR33DRAFT_712964 [Rhizoclosmatium globosum]